MYHFYYVAESQFDKEDATNNRIINNIKAITSKNDFTVTIVGYGNSEEITKDGIKIKNVKKGKSYLSKMLYYLFRGFFVVKLLNKEPIQPDLIIYYGSNFRFFYPLMKYIKKKRIKIVCDIVEWFNPSHLPLGRYGPSAIDVNIGFKYYVKRCSGVIVISSFLKEYFDEMGIKTLLIPVLADPENYIKAEKPERFFDEEYLNLIYAGFPGKKDLILNAIESVKRLSTAGVKIRFHLFGPSPEEIGEATLKDFPDVIIGHNRLEQKTIRGYLKQADFSVLLRPIERYSKAGFPTKFVESLSAGLPVIANLTSDLSYYLKDGYNGFIVNDYSIESLENLFEKISLMDKDLINEMRRNALTTAKYFHYNYFSERFSTFFNEIL
jgi:glycosyltransferase involved in cell wall biosynthesis